MEREYKCGAHVTYVDQFGKEQEAIVNQWWGDVSAYQPNKPIPGCNLVFVVDDESKTDNYGRQIQRETSVVHKSNQAANGRFWKWPEEK